MILVKCQPLHEFYWKENAKITGCRGFSSNLVYVYNFVKPKLFKAAQPPAIQ